MFPNAHRFFIAIAMLCAGCAVTPQSTLKPGTSTEAEVEASMGPSVDRRQTSNGEIVRYYSRLPSGHETYAARFGADGKLIAIEQRLTMQNVNRIIAGKWRAADVRELLGPPYEIQHFTLQQIEVWSYPMMIITGAAVATVDIGADGVVQEVVVLDDRNKTP